MRSISRQALAGVRAQLDELADTVSPQALWTLAEELFEVVGLLETRPVLRRHFADSTAPGQARQELLQSLLSGKVEALTMEILRSAVLARWSTPGDLVEGVETLSSLALLTIAGRDNTLEGVEDELFRFGRILEGESRLQLLLTDPAAPADHRIELLRNLIGDKTHPVTRRLLEQAVRLPRGRSLDVVALELADMAATRRQRYLAYVSGAIPLTRVQNDRLTAALRRIYRREISLHVEIEPSLIGGLVIRVGDEVIDGSVAGRLDEARHRLAS